MLLIIHVEPKHRFNSHSSTLKSSFNEQNNQINSSHINNHTNPFLSAPFHRSPGTKRILTNSSIDIDRKPTTNNLYSSDLNSIIVGQRTSAFAPYQKREVNVENSGKFSSSFSD